METGEIIGQFLLGCLGILLTYYLSALRRTVEALQKTDERLESRLNQIEVRMAEKYLTKEEAAMANRDMREDLKSLRNEIIDKLTGIENYLLRRIDTISDKKADK